MKAVRWAHFGSSVLAVWLISSNANLVMALVTISLFILSEVLTAVLVRQSSVEEWELLKDAAVELVEAQAKRIEELESLIAPK
jgi:hypothetical protein